MGHFNLRYVLLFSAFTLVPACGGRSFELVEGTGGDAGITDSSMDATQGEDVSPPVDSAGSDVTDSSIDSTPGEDVSPPIDSAGSDVTDSSLELGSPCIADIQCASDSCEDGVCCEGPCGPCEVCNDPSSLGTCAVALGANPKEVCGVTNDPCSGHCDELGECVYPVGEKCGQATCDKDGVKWIESHCDAAGECIESVQSCFPYACDEESMSCFVSCEMNSHACAGDAFCDNDTCQGKQPDGETCVMSTSCLSGNCVHGYCCDDACEGTCRRCDLSGNEGQCSPVPAGQDPDGDCVGIDVACGGTCDGFGACSYPGTASICGQPRCHETKNSQIMPRCDGSGVCLEVVEDCGLFKCSEPTCLSECQSNIDCVDNAYCASSKCIQKLDNGATCSDGQECLSGFCVATSAGNRCCNTICPGPLDCATGNCLCDGVVCAAGIECVAWFRDVDKDGFGDPAVMIAGCSDTPPTDAASNLYVRDSSDCYDLNPLVYPHQTEWFGVPRGDGSFDYDCNSTAEKEFNDTLSSTAVCSDCRTYLGCFGCGLGVVSGFDTYGYVCKKEDNKCSVSVWQSFKQQRACGEKGTLFECNRTGGISSCTNAEVPRENTVQRCR